MALAKMARFERAFWSKFSSPDDASRNLRCLEFIHRPRSALLGHTLMQILALIARAESAIISARYGWQLRGETRPCHAKLLMAFESLASVPPQFHLKSFPAIEQQSQRKAGKLGSLNRVKR